MVKKIEKRMALVCPDCGYIFPFIPTKVRIPNGAQVFCSCADGKWIKTTRGWKWWFEKDGDSK